MINHRETQEIIAHLPKPCLSRPMSADRFISKLDLLNGEFCPIPVLDHFIKGLQLVTSLSLSWILLCDQHTLLLPCKGSCIFYSPTLYNFWETIVGQVSRMAPQSNLSVDQKSWSAIVKRACDKWEVNFKLRFKTRWRNCFRFIWAALMSVTIKIVIYKLRLGTWII